MLDIHSFIMALKLTWVRRIQESDNSQWLKLVNSGIINTKKFLEMGVVWHRNYLPKIANPFLKEVLSCWITFHKKFQPVSKAEAMCTPIWNNPNISSTSLFNNNLYKKGCVYIADICDPFYKIYDYIYERCIQYNNKLPWLSENHKRVK